MSDFSLNSIIREAGVACQASNDMHLVELARHGISKKITAAAFRGRKLVT